VTDDAPAPATLWHGRFGAPPADELLQFTASLSFDRRLAPDDLRGSRAHVAMLAAVGLIDDAERQEIERALEQVERELADGSFVFVPTDEDIHTAIERRVTELSPDAGAKLHTGRSRNDQVATDLRLFLRRAGRDQAERLLAFCDVLVDRAEMAGDATLPGYTHLQRAQPVTLAHHLLAHVWPLTRDVGRWLDCLERADVSPLGAGALAGSTLPIDPQRTAGELGFANVFESSLDAVSDRDFVAEALFVCALVQVHLSRIGEEVVLWSSEEFGFLRLADEHATGSSMMPQKRNPDVAELARGKTGRVVGDLVALLTTLKGLPLTYNRDLQEDKEPLFDALDTCSGTLASLGALLRTAELRTDRMAAASADESLLATDLAEWLVGRGVAFRQTHAIVGELVRRSIDERISLRDAVVASEHFGPDAAELLDPAAALARRASAGGPAPEQVRAQLQQVRTTLARLRAAVDGLPT
jgi:argininosuccinate lyase